MPNEPCRNPKCARYEMTQMEFRRLRRELWDDSFSSRLGKLATKLHLEMYRRKPRRQRAFIAERNSVNLYPCGILEEAYARLRSQGVPLIRPHSRLARDMAQRREQKERVAKVAASKDVTPA